MYLVFEIQYVQAYKALQGYIKSQQPAQNGNTGCGVPTMIQNYHKVANSSTSWLTNQ